MKLILSGSSLSGGLSSVLIFSVVIILIVARRAYRNYTGVKVTPARTIGYTIFYFAFGAFFLALSFTEGVPFYYAAPDIVLLGLGAYFSHKLSDRRISFWKTSDGSIFYKGAIIIYGIYIVGLAARLTIEVIFIGPSAFNFAPITLSQTAILATVITDMLLTFGIGLLIGRNIRIYQRYNLIIQGKEVVTTA